MEELIKFIKENTVKNTQEVTESILNMYCGEKDYTPLSYDKLLNALQIKGEFLVLKLHYSDFDSELKEEKIKYKISQALSIIVTYEDDGNSFEDIKKFVTYIHDISDKKQNSIFGVKKVKKLSKYPITILFSGILPINQLKMSVGQKIYDFIHSDDDYFKPRFEHFRDELSKEINTPILPVFPLLDKSLGDTEVTLVDLLDGRLISKFETIKEPDKDVIEQYLLKLFYIYKILATKSK